MAGIGEKPMTRSGPYFLDRMHVGGGDDLVDLVPARTHEAAEAAHALVILALGVVLDDRRPRVDRILRQPRLAPQLEQAAAHHRVLHAVGAVEVPRVRGTARAAARFVVGHVPARARVVGLLGFPGDDAALDVNLPRAGARAIHAVRRTHDLVVRPAVAVGVLPGTVFTVGDAVVAGKRLFGLGKIAESIEEVAHGMPLVVG
jgi:hypothetical protein